MPTIDGRPMRAWRRSRGWDAPETARRIRRAADELGQTAAEYDGLVRMVYSWERGEHALSERYALLCAKALGVSPDDLPAGPVDQPDISDAPHGQSDILQVSGITGAQIIPSVEEEQEEVERRRLLQSLAILGVSVSPLSQALETVRTAFGKTVGYDERNHLDYWEEATVEYGYSYLYASPADLVPDLAADLLTVRSIIHRIPDRDSAEYRSWCRVGGALSALMAKSLSNLGYSRNSREWWSMAHHLADASSDRNLSLLVRGEHIIHGLYERRPVPVLLRQVESAANIASSQPCVGFLDLIGARAQVSVLAGDYRSAEEDLHRTEEILEQIPPSSATNGTGLVMLWGEAEFRYTEAWVYSHMGEDAKIDRAAEQAFSLYPASDKRSPVQIKLMQAFARVRRGDITEGIQHAQAVYEPLAFERTTMVDALARGVLNAIPAEEWKRSDVAGYRELVTSRAPERMAIEA